MIDTLKKFFTGINWKVRIENKLFWASMISSVVILIQAFANLFGFVIDLTELQGKLFICLDAIFGVLLVLGVVVDHTTAGVGDSERAMGYSSPKE